MPQISPAQIPPDDARRRRILFRATHRGTYENDILVGSFVRKRLDGFTEADLDALEEIMELPDALLADWLTGRQPIPASVDTPMLRAIRTAAESGEAQPAAGHESPAAGHENPAAGHESPAAGHGNPAAGQENMP